MRFVAGTLIVVALAAPARADDVVVQGSAGLGAGILGAEPVSAAELRGDVAWDGGAAGLGARLRIVGDRIERADWDEVADWLALVRYVVVRNRAEREATRLDTAPDDRGRAAVALGALGGLRTGAGTIVDGFTAAALADRRATGLDARLGRGGASGELIVGDLARGTVIAGAGEAPVGPVVVGGGAAVDPRAPTRDAVGLVDTTPLVALDASAGVVRVIDGARGRLQLDAGWEPGLGAGLAVVGDGELRVGDRTFLRGRAELGAGSPRWIAAPFGPLYLRLREDAGPGGDTMPAPTLVDRARGGELGGIGGALALAADADDVGSLAASVRVRPGLGPEVAARASAPAAARIQAAAFAAWMPTRDALLVGAEGRGELGHGMWTALEIARQYRAGDTLGLYAERPVWQVTAWFGVAGLR